jgi:hypothetical protein
MSAYIVHGRRAADVSFLFLLFLIYQGRVWVGVEGLVRTRLNSSRFLFMSMLYALMFNVDTH